MHQQQHQPWNVNMMYSGQQQQPYQAQQQSAQVPVMPHHQQQNQHSHHQSHHQQQQQQQPVFTANSQAFSQYPTGQGQQGSTASSATAGSYQQAPAQHQQSHQQQPYAFPQQQPQLATAPPQHSYYAAPTAAGAYTMPGYPTAYSQPQANAQHAATAPNAAGPNSGMFAPPGSVVVQAGQGTAGYVLLQTNPSYQPQQLQPNVVVRKKLPSAPTTPSAPEHTKQGTASGEAGNEAREGNTGAAANSELPALNCFVKLPEGIPRPKLPVGVAQPTYL